MITLTWQEGLSKPLGIPKTAVEVMAQDIEELLADSSVNLESWQKGEEFSNLRFELGDRVECRIGEDAITGWAAGSVLQLMYRESNWPPGVFAPYQIQLDDGRQIFAPHDIDQVIRAEQGIPELDDDDVPELEEPSE